MNNILDHQVMFVNFDNGELDCLNFWVSTEDETYTAGIDHIKTLRVVTMIREAIKQGRNYIVTPYLVYGGVRILEITWG